MKYSFIILITILCLLLPILYHNYNYKKININKEKDSINNTKHTKHNTAPCKATSSSCC